MYSYNCVNPYRVLKRKHQDFIILNKNNLLVKTAWLINYL